MTKKRDIDFLTSIAGLLSKGLITETEDELFLTDKGHQAVRQKLEQLGDEVRLLFVLSFLEMVEEQGQLKTEGE